MLFAFKKYLAIKTYFLCTRFRNCIYFYKYTCFVFEYIPLIFIGIHPYFKRVALQHYHIGLH